MEDWGLIMLSTVMEVGAIIALIGGTAYFFFQYAPMIIDFFNQLQIVVSQLSVYVPDWLQPFIIISLLLSGIGLLVKLL